MSNRDYLIRQICEMSRAILHDYNGDELVAMNDKQLKAYYREVKETYTNWMDAIGGIFNG